MEKRYAYEEMIITGNEMMLGMSEVVPMKVLEGG